MWEKLPLEAVSTKLDTIRSILKLDRCLKFMNEQFCSFYGSNKYF